MEHIVALSIIAMLFVAANKKTGCHSPKEQYAGLRGDAACRFGKRSILLTLFVPFVSRTPQKKGAAFLCGSPMHLTGFRFSSLPA